MTLRISELSPVMSDCSNGGPVFLHTLTPANQQRHSTEVTDINHTQKLKSIQVPIFHKSVTASNASVTGCICINVSNLSV